MFIKINISCVVTLGLLLLGGCKDGGTETPPKIPGLGVSNTNVILVVGDSTNVTISNGITPYSIKTQPINIVATAVLTSSNLKIKSTGTGNTSLVVEDSKSPVRDTVKVNIAVVSNVSFSSQIQPIFNASCASCHGSSGGLNLSASVSYANLVNVSAQSSCTTLKRVLPNNASQSVLYLKVAGTSCGNRMPQGGSLTTDQINLIQVWITQGAINN